MTWFPHNKPGVFQQNPLDQEEIRIFDILKNYPINTPLPLDLFMRANLSNTNPKRIWLFPFLLPVFIANPNPVNVTVQGNTTFPTSTIFKDGDQTIAAPGIFQLWAPSGPTVRLQVLHFTLYLVSNAGTRAEISVDNFTANSIFFTYVPAAPAVVTPYNITLPGNGAIGTVGTNINIRALDGDLTAYWEIDGNEV